MCDHAAHVDSIPTAVPSPLGPREGRYTPAATEAPTSSGAPDPVEHPLLDTLTISERKIHRTCLKAHLVGNAARLRFIRALRAAAETRLYIKLGYPTVHQYAKDKFQCENTQAHEFLRMAKLLEKLPLMTHDLCFPPSVPPGGR